MKPPQPFSEQHPAFRIEGWDELGKIVPAQQLVRHFLITGETGSGKSASGVIPSMEAILRYPEADLYEDYARAVENPDAADLLRPAVLVIDPKRELTAVVERLAGERRISRVGEDSAALHLFEGKQNIDSASMVDFILQQSDFFVQDQARGDDPIWNIQAGEC